MIQLSQALHEGDRNKEHNHEDNRSHKYSYFTDPKLPKRYAKVGPVNIMRFRSLIGHPQHWIWCLKNLWSHKSSIPSFKEHKSSCTLLQLRPQLKSQNCRLKKFLASYITFSIYIKIYIQSLKIRKNSN